MRADLSSVSLTTRSRVLFQNDGGWRVADRPAKIHDTDITGLPFTPVGQHRLSVGSGGGGGDRTAAITPLANRAAVHRLQSRQASGSVEALATGTGLVAAGDHDGRVLLWYLTDFRFIGALQAGTSVASTLAIDMPRRRMVSYSADGSILS
jgi:hypothetical protein